MNVLHLTAHLGGGVGRCMQALVSRSRAAASGVRHVFACLETPEKDRFVRAIEADGGQVVVRPEPAALHALAASADIVQLEWWNHPATLQCLCETDWPAMRLCVWSHVSGLHTPVFPPPLLRAAQRFLFSSPCSYESAAVQGLDAAAQARLAVVPSSGGFDGLPLPEEAAVSARLDRLTAGYFGSLNLAKIHPRYVELAAAVRLPGFQVRMVGDVLNRDRFERQAAAAGRPGLLVFDGYRDDVAAALADIDVNLYLLNPQHYGTCENALLESMALGIVPVVLDNACERCIVSHGETGLVVSDGEQLAAACDWLAAHPQERRRMALAAAHSVRQRFSAQATHDALHGHYRAMLATAKEAVDFRAVFGDSPARWFLACQAEPQRFGADGRIDARDGEALAEGLFERTKGSVFHFSACFPADPLLRGWARGLEALH